MGFLVVDLKLDGALRSSQLELGMTTMRREWLGLHECSDQLLVCWPGKVYFFRSNTHGLQPKGPGDYLRSNSRNI
jgi:hypothetical protein